MPVQTGKYLIVLGLVIVLVGIIWYFFGDKLGWIGKLPGDIRVEKPGFSFYFPLTTMIIASLLLSVLFYVLRKFL